MLSKTDDKLFSFDSWLYQLSLSAGNELILQLCLGVVVSKGRLHLFPHYKLHFMELTTLSL